MLPYLPIFSQLKYFFIISPFISFALYLVHPCDKRTKGGCDQTCNKEGDSFSCSCETGFKLEGDGRSCKKSKNLLIFIVLVRSMLLNLW